MIFPAFTLQQDADLIPDAVEKVYVAPTFIDTDKDGTPDWQDLDSDNDGLPDILERGPGPGPSNDPIDSGAFSVWMLVFT